MYTIYLIENTINNKIYVGVTDKTQKEISSLYPISQRIVSDINTEKIWKEVKPQKPDKWQE